MSVPNCYAKVTKLMKSLGRNLDESELREIAVQLSEMRLESPFSSNLFNETATKLYVDRLTQEANAVRAQKIINLQKITAARAAVLQPIDGMSLPDKVNAFILGNARQIGNALNLSIEHGRATLISNWTRGLRSVLEQAKDLEVAESNLLKKEITQEMAGLESGAGKSLSGSTQAYRIAKAYHGMLAQIFEVKQAFDPFLGKIQDYYYRASHDIRKVSSVPRDEWVSFAMQKYGQKSFPELVGEKKVAAFANVYDQISKGYYDSMLEFDTDGLDIMRRMAAKRTLIPNDWKAFHEYNEVFGRDNVHTSVVRAIESAAHDVAVLQKWGSQPKATFDGLMSTLLKTSPKEDIERLKVDSRKFEDNFKVTTQRSSALAVGQGAKLTRGALAVNQFTKNSGAFLRSIQDLANMTTLMTDTTGGSYIGNLVEATTSYSKYLFSSQKTRTEAIQDKFLFARSALMNFYEEFGGNAQVLSDSRTDTFNAWMSKALEVQSHVTLMNKHITSIDAAMANILSRRLGRMTERAHASLDIQTQGALKRYGIGALEWDTIRQGVEDWSSKPGVEKAMGPMDRMLTIDGIASIPRDVLSNYVRESGRHKGAVIPNSVLVRARTDLELKVGSLINDHAMSASSTASQAERAFLYRNTDTNSGIGIGLRLMFQFKSALVKNYNTMMRSMYSNPLKPRGDKTRVARHIVLSSGLWAIGETAKSLLEGKTPEDVSPKFVARALVESGGAGLFGDAVLSEIIKDGNIAGGIARSVSGPTFSLGYDVSKIIGKLGYSLDDGKFPGNDIARTATQLIPYQNLFYAKAAMNYFYLNGIREWGDADYLNKVEDRVQDKGQEFWMPKTNESFWDNL